MTEKLSVTFFRNLLKKNIAKLKGHCKDWEKIGKGSDVPEMVCDEIRTTVGLTNLLMEQKLKQFAGLIDDCELKRGEKEITCLDLQGFWDMVYNEVYKIQRRFENLEICRQNNWVFLEKTITKQEPKKKPTVANVTKLAMDSKARALAARQRLAEAKMKMKAQMSKQSENSVVVQMSTQKEISPKKKLKADQEIPESESKIVSEAQSPLKRTLKNIRNLKISEQDNVSGELEAPLKKPALKERAKNTKTPKSSKKDKENIVKNIEESTVQTMQKDIAEKLPAVELKSRKRNKKQLPPLRIVTRSAARAMLAQQTQNNLK